MAALFDLAHVVATRAKHGLCVNCGKVERLSADVPFCELCTRRASYGAVDLVVDGIARRR